MWAVRSPAQVFRGGNPGTLPYFIFTVYIITYTVPYVKVFIWFYTISLFYCLHLSSMVLSNSQEFCIERGKKMPVSEAQRKASEKWDKDKVDSLHLRVKKGMREVIQTHAEQHGESVNGFINRAIVETMERDNDR